MPTKPFKIVPDKEVGKTEVLYKGDERHLKKMRDHFSSTKSSDVYPSFDDEYRFTLFFYDTSEDFLSKLYQYSKEQLPRLTGREEGTDLWFYIKWAGVTAGIIFALYVSYAFVNWIIGAKEIVDGQKTGTTIQQEVKPGE